MLNLIFFKKHLILSFSQKFFEPLKTPEFVEVATATMENVTKQVQEYLSVELVEVWHVLVSDSAASIRHTNHIHVLFTGLDY